MHDLVDAAETLVDHAIIDAAIIRRSTRSTSDDAKRFAIGGAAKSVILFAADQQTAGRGRGGRSWVSGGLTFTVLVRRGTVNIPPAPAPSIAVSIAESIERHVDEAIGIKWPNDLVLRDQHDQLQKVGGLLIERFRGRDGRDWESIGIGINVRPIRNNVDEYRLPAGRLPIARRSVLLSEVVRNLVQIRQVSFIGAFRSRCVLTGHVVEYHHNGQRKTGRCLGIDEAFNLRIDGELGPQTLSSGEVHRVRLG